MRSTRVGFLPRLNKANWFVSILLLLTGLPVRLGAQNTTFDLREQTDNAHIVIVGAVSSVNQVGTSEIEISGHRLESRNFEAHVRVDRILKGGGESVPPQIMVRFILPISPAGWVGYSGIDAGTYRILFLKRTDAYFEFANPSSPSLPATAQAAFSIDTDPLTMLIYELAEVIDSPQAVETDKLRIIYQLGATSNASTAEQTAVIDALRRPLAGSDPAIRAAATSALLQQNYTPALSIAQRILMNPPTDVPKYLIDNMASAIARGVRDEKAIPVLSRLLKAPDTHTREAAASALRDIHSPQAVGPLALALSDGDRKVRYYAVIGLAEITTQPEWRPLEEEFQAHEEHYLNHWKNWAKQQN